MIRYYRRYQVLALVLSLLATAALIVLYAWLTGFRPINAILAWLMGLTLFAIIASSGLSLASRYADKSVERIVDCYNRQCDPQAFLTAGSTLKTRIKAPLSEPGAWFLSLWGQASLEVGNAVEARQALAMIQQSEAQSSNSMVRAALLTNSIPLLLKLEDVSEAQKAVRQGLETLKSVTTIHGLLEQNYLMAQDQLYDDIQNRRLVALRERYRAIRFDGGIAMRLRVENAWNEARVCYELQDRAEEIDCLHFICAFGNQLALVRLAEARLRTFV